MTLVASLPDVQTRVIALQWQEERLLLLDQTRLPQGVAWVSIETVPDLIRAIQAMVVRGAPAIGIAGAYGVVLSALTHQNLPTPEAFRTQVTADAQRIAAARPTAVNLAWAVDQMLAVLAAHPARPITDLLVALTHEAQALHEADRRMCLAMGHIGAPLIPQGARIMTLCNAGALATGGIGTALGVIRCAFAQDPTLSVYACETRPRLQGAKLTAWELQQDGIPVTLITDAMAAWLMRQGAIDLVITGADRIARNGDSANKIGTYMLAVCAHAHQLPFYIAAPSSTLDPSLASGEAIPIETRPPEEITHLGGVPLCAPGTPCINPAFDVTPANLITAIVTESGVSRPPFRFS